MSNSKNLWYNQPTDNRAAAADAARALTFGPHSQENLAATDRAIVAPAAGRISTFSADTYYSQSLAPDVAAALTALASSNAAVNVAGFDAAARMAAMGQDTARVLGEDAFRTASSFGYDARTLAENAFDDATNSRNMSLEVFRQGREFLGDTVGATIEGFNAAMRQSGDGQAQAFDLVKDASAAVNEQLGIALSMTQSADKQLSDNVIKSLMYVGLAYAAVMAIRAYRRR